MATRTYHGSCHCGQVRFEADLDLRNGTAKCNCSICMKTRNWMALAKPKEFRLLAGDSALSDYQFGSKNIHHFFCNTCGVRPFAHGAVEAAGGEFFAVKLNCLDDVDPAELADAPVEYLDGVHDDFAHAPAVTRHL